MDTTINQRVKEIADKLCDGNVSELARVSGINQPAYEMLLEQGKLNHALRH